MLGGANIRRETTPHVVYLESIIFTLAFPDCLELIFYFFLQGVRVYMEASEKVLRGSLKSCKNSRELAHYTHSARLCVPKKL